MKNFLNRPVGLESIGGNQKGVGTAYHIFAIGTFALRSGQERGPASTKRNKIYCRGRFEIDPSGNARGQPGGSVTRPYNQPAPVPNCE